MVGHRGWSREDPPHEHRPRPGVLGGVRGEDVDAVGDVRIAVVEGDGEGLVGGGGQAVGAEREVLGRELKGGPGRLAGALTTRTATPSCGGRRGAGLGGLAGQTLPQAQGDQSRPQ